MIIISEIVNFNGMIESQLNDVLLNIEFIEEVLKNINENQFYDNLNQSAEKVIEKLTFISRRLNKLTEEFPDLIEDKFIRNYGILAKKGNKTISTEKILVYNNFALFYKKIWNKITQLGLLKERVLILRSKILL